MDVCGDGDEVVGPLCADPRGDALLSARVCVAVKEAYGPGLWLRPLALQGFEEVIERRGGRRPGRIVAEARSVCDHAGAVERHQTIAGGGLPGEERLSVLSPDGEQIGEAFVHDEQGRLVASLEERVGAHGGAVDEEPGRVAPPEPLRARLDRAGDRAARIAGVDGTLATTSRSDVHATASVKVPPVSTAMSHEGCVDTSCAPAG